MPQLAEYFPEKNGVKITVELNLTVSQWPMNGLEGASTVFDRTSYG